MKTGGPPLFGRVWMDAFFGPTWFKDLRVDAVDETPPEKGPTPEKSVNDLLSKYQDVFTNELGTLRDIKSKLTVKPDTVPVFCKPRPVPYALRPAVDSEIDRLLKLGVLTPVDHSDWATPIVVIPKKDNSVRICGDFKVTVNPNLQIDQYPLPKIDDIFANLSGGKHFTKLDLRTAYMQMEMEDESKEYLTINTHRGLFRYNRLIYGIASAPAIWQRTMEQILQGIDGVQCLIDDMIVTGASDSEHLRNLENVLQRLQRYGLRANVEKCNIFKEKVEFCGHVIDAEGLHKTTEKVRAIVEAKTPENVSELRAFLGLVNYYGKFLPNLATVLRPLYMLLEKDRKWTWTPECGKAFNRVKELMQSDNVLVHYDPSLPLRLSCDASPYGLGAVLSHVYPSGEEKPIAFGSRSLNSAERNYSQIDKEALGIVWGIKHFQIYLYGRHFSLVTDHQPLVSIFNPSKGIPLTTAARLQRYAIFLSGLDYSIEYRNTKSHGNADGLSRLPLPTDDTNTDDIVDSTHVFHVTQLEALPVTAEEVKQQTARDPILSRAYDATMRGWGDNDDSDLQPYFRRRTELTVHQGCLLWGIRVVIPETLRKDVLNLIHDGHLGVVKMKAMARSHVWWPGIDADIENCARSCTGCAENRNTPPETPIHPWEYPNRPWQRIHVDFAGPFLGSMFLIVVDARSKWPEVFAMKSTTAERTVDVLRTIFARNGLPEHLISDNGPQFVSEEFRRFMKINGIRHTTSSPYHPKTNGLAERFVQTFKSAMKSAEYDEGTLQKKLANFLIAYRNAPQSTTGESPAQLFMGRSLGTRLERIRPDVARTVRRSQEKVEERIKSKVRTFSIGEHVMVRDYRNNHKWMPGTVSKQTGPVSYKIEIAPGMEWRRHTDQIYSSVPPPVADLVPELPVDIPKSVPKQAEVLDTPPPISVDTPASEPPKTPSPPAERRYPVRIRKPPQRLDL